MQFVHTSLLLSFSSKLAAFCIVIVIASPLLKKSGIGKMQMRANCL
jgi:predicted ABC-type exoprotein transport system permease subunit